MQRRVNFLVSALGSVNTTLEAASETIDVDVQMQPYKLEDLKDKIDTAIKAKDGEICRSSGPSPFVGNVDSVLERDRSHQGRTGQRNQKNDIEKQRQLYFSQKFLVNNLKNRTIKSEKLRGLYKLYG